MSSRKGGRRERADKEGKGRGGGQAGLASTPVPM